MKQRESGLDILRLMALFFVNGVHSFLYNGFYSQPQVGAGMWVANCLRWTCYGCIGLFLMLTGYLKSQKPLNRQYFFSLVPILLGYLLTCVISFPIRHFLLDDKLTLAEWIEKMFTFGNYAWYVEMYIGLLLISPVINLALGQLKTEKELKWAAAIAFCVTALPSVTKENWIPNYWTALYPFTYYVLGAVIRRLQPKVQPLEGIILTAFWVGAMGMISLLSTDEGFSKVFTQGYGGFWVTVMVSLIFLSFYRVKLKPKAAKIAAWMAGGVFEGYILSRLFDVWIYGKFPQWHRPQYYPLILLVITLPVFLCSVLMGKGTHTLVELILKPFRRKQPVKSGKKAK